MVFQNTSAVAKIDGDEVNTIHASEMADLVASYARSTAVVVDTSDVHVMIRALRGEMVKGDEDDMQRSRRLANILALAVGDGLR